MADKGCTMGGLEAFPLRPLVNGDQHSIWLSPRVGNIRVRNHGLAEAGKA
ncbi:predicted protein [Coccidioides posadasii str. Silveira]|uniref:Predicted protein n=1 Tax=Coccidioides posadasii (strain RMSCC 757 / Silveira) TaxID=443226 RepID=E9DEK1_COCPS|nr:predicted protein [Coccidioides posadasii str. Silveira]